MKKTKVVISIKGGLVESVMADTPNIDLEIWDWDCIMENPFHPNDLDLDNLDAKVKELNDDFKKLSKRLHLVY